MKRTMKLNDILASLDDDVEKTASENHKETEETLESGKKELMSALKSESTAEAKKDKEVEKTASPVSDLEKIASQIAEAEEEALVKQAQLYGAAVCDGYMMRLSQYEKAAEELQTSNQEKIAEEKLAAIFSNISDEEHALADNLVKEAAEAGEKLSHEEALIKLAEEAYSIGYNEATQGDSQEKLASLFKDVTEEEFAYADSMVKEASEQGEEISHEQVLVKMAEDAYNLGYQETMEKTASLAYAQGFEDTIEKIAQDLQEAGETEAVEALEKAAFEAGYSDAMEKMAASAFERGYEDMASLLG